MNHFFSALLQIPTPKLKISAGTDDIPVLFSPQL